MTTKQPRLTSPQQLSQQLAKQWQNTKTREKRLLARQNLSHTDNDNNPTIYPIQLAIPAPPATLLTEDLSAVKAHLAAWKNINIGTVIWTTKTYRHLKNPLDIPRQWQLNNNDEWIAAADTHLVRHEYRHYQLLFHHVSSVYHPLLARHKKIVVERDIDTLMQACQLAEQLTPNIANGAPLRTLSLAGIDSKFFENHRQLIIKLLDCRFNGAASEQGLEHFLGAGKDEHWLLVVDLDGHLLPFQQQKIRTSELQYASMPPCRLLLCENIQVAHTLPRLPNTLAILGSGLDLCWLQAEWTERCEIGYWGDMDTWGLAMLARARDYRPQVKTLLMNRALFQYYANSGKAVAETTHANAYVADVFHRLSHEEQQLYEQLKDCELGRVEQEFITRSDVTGALNAVW